IVKRHDEKDFKHQKAKQQFSTLHISFNVYPDLYNLVSSSDGISSDPQILKISALSLENLQNIKVMLAKNWSIMINESNSINEKHLDIATQYMSLNVPNFIFNKDLNIENIAHFGSDGSKTGVSILLILGGFLCQKWFIILHQILDSVKDDFITADNKQADLMYILTKLINIFQRDYVSISDIQFNLETTISAITTQFIGYDNTPPIYALINISDI
ncbi:18777_t:CDS:2, partial [Gigaspora rosea]